MSTLEIRNLSKSFAGLKAVDDVSFTVSTGDIFGLIGPNGSGKTTLINVVTGLLPATSGSVLVDDQETTGKPPHRVARAGISRTFQTIRLFDELTVAENVVVAGMSVGLSRKQSLADTEDLLDEFELGAFRDRLAGEVPFGSQRRLEIARALVMRPKFLLLDEPAAGLNEDESDRLLLLLLAIPEGKDVGMLIVDHDMRLMMKLCGTLHVLNYGRTIAHGNPEQVRANPEVVSAYLGGAA